MWIRVIGLDAFFGMAGYLFWLVLVEALHWADSASVVGLYRQECALGAYSDDVWESETWERL